MKYFNSLAKNRITIQNKIETDDALGGFVQSWEDYKTVWAIIKPYSGISGAVEIFRNQQLESVVSTEIIIRYDSALSNTRFTANKRIICNVGHAYINQTLEEIEETSSDFRSISGKFYEILAVRNINDLKEKNEGKVFQILSCKEVEGEQA